MLYLLDKDLSQVGRCLRMEALMKNTEFQINRLVYYKKCKHCDLTAFWQHEREEESTLENFKKFLLADGWTKNWLGWWSCKIHNSSWRLSKLK